MLATERRGLVNLRQRFGLSQYATEEQMLNALKKLGLGGRKFEPMELIGRIQHELPLPLDVEPVEELSDPDIRREFARTRSYGGVQYVPSQGRMRLVYLSNMDQMEIEDVLLHEAAHIIRRHAIPVGSSASEDSSQVPFVRPPGVTNLLRRFQGVDEFSREKPKARELIRFYEHDATIGAKHLWLAAKNGLDVYRRDEKLLGLC